MSKWQICYSRS